jgi:hypothetical protein
MHTYHHHHHRDRGIGVFVPKYFVPFQLKVRRHKPGVDSNGKNQDQVENKEAHVRQILK